MLDLVPARPGGFCWLDLAATDAARAKLFYAQAFGWSFRDQHADAGLFTRWTAGGQEIASQYQLRRAQLEAGVPSHWTPYILVDNVDAAALRIIECGGRVIVAPFDAPGTARIALIEDAVGALLGLWEALDGRHSTSRHQR
jgi:predicted enzyme related to lactoylglutathione lyase